MPASTVDDRPSTQEGFPRWVWTMAALSLILHASGSLLLLVGFRQQAFDLAIYDQSIWLLARGEWFNTVAGIHVFGAHLSPILFALAPLSFVPGGAIPELVVQASVVASGVFPAYRVAAHLGSPRALTLVYAVHPALVTGGWFGFRPWNLAAPFLMWAIWFLLKRPTLTVLLLAGGAGLVFREDIAAWVALGALVLVLGGRFPLRDWVLGTSILGALTLVVLTVIIPRWSPVESYLYEGAVGSGADTSVASGLASLASRAAFLLLPMGLGLRVVKIPTLGLLLVPAMGLVLLGGNALVPGFHYEMLFVPVLILILALRSDVVPKTSWVVAGCLICAVAFAPLRPFEPQVASNPLSISPGLVTDAIAVRNMVLERTNGATAIAAPSELVPHLSERERIFTFPYPFDRAAFEPYPMDCPDPDIVIATEPLARGATNWRNAIDRYDLVDAEGPYLVYRLSSEPNSAESCGPA